MRHAFLLQEVWCKPQNSSEQHPSKSDSKIFLVAAHGQAAALPGVVRGRAPAHSRLQRG